MYKLIACDLDETLIRTDRTISARNEAAVRALAPLGVHFVPATGRGFDTIGETLAQLGLGEREGEYAITYNGGSIVETATGHVLNFDGLPFEKANELWRRGLDYDVCIHVYTHHQVFAYNLVPNEVAYLQNRMPIEEVHARDLEFLRGQDIAKVLYMNTDMGYLRSIERDLEPITGDVDVSFSSSRYIEFNRRGVNKGAGLVTLAGMLDIDLADVIAIGDNYNDLPMIERAGLGVGVANTEPGMRHLCDHITHATCNEDAVAEVIEEFVLAPASLQYHRDTSR